MLKEFTAHSIILCARSNNFYKEFTTRSARHNGIITFTKPNISPLVFGILLE